MLRGEGCSSMHKIPCTRFHSLSHMGTASEESGIERDSSWCWDVHLAEAECAVKQRKDISLTMRRVRVDLRHGEQGDPTILLMHLEKAALEEQKKMHFEKNCGIALLFYRSSTILCLTNCSEGLI